MEGGREEAWCCYSQRVIGRDETRVDDDERGNSNGRGGGINVLESMGAREKSKVFDADNLLFHREQRISRPLPLVASDSSNHLDDVLSRDDDDKPPPISQLLSASFHPGIFIDTSAPSHPSHPPCPCSFFKSSLLRRKWDHPR